MLNAAKLKSHLISYALALVATGIGFFLRIAITHFTGPGLPTYVTFYPFVMFSAIFGGLGAGILTTVTSGLIAKYYFVPSIGNFYFDCLSEAVGFALFICMGLLMSVAAMLYRRGKENQEKTIRLANIYNRSLIEASLDPFVTISQEGKITDVNDATTKVTGMPRDMLIGTDFLDYFTEPEKARHGYQDVFSKGFVSDYPLTIRRRDGKLTDVLYNASVYKDDKGDILGVFASARDVSKLHDLQNKLVRSEKLACIGKLASSVAHELRNPLGVMKNITYYLDMLELTKENPELKENLNIINQEIENSDKIIEDLLGFSRSKEPVFHSENSSIIIKEMLDRLTIPSNIELTLELKDNLPQVEVDALQMHQVFYNLTKNAVEVGCDKLVTIR